MRLVKVTFLGYPLYWWIFQVTKSVNIVFHSTKLFFVCLK